MPKRPSPSSPRRPRRPGARSRLTAGVLAGAAALSLAAAPSAAAGSPAPEGGAGTAAAGAPSFPWLTSVLARSSSLSSRACPPAAVALSYSDALDKAVVDGAVVGGLSDLAYDPVEHSYAATVDNHGTDPARLYHIGSPYAPRITEPPLVLERPDGTPYTGLDADDEGLAVLPDGRYLVSSETEPSIRIFGRDGVQQGQLTVPARFAVAPAGGATANATLEGLTISPSGRYVVAAMEGTLSGDLPAGGGEGVFRRFLVYRHAGSSYRLVRQVAYRVEPGMRVPEVAAYDDGRLVVEEASFSAATGNAVSLYAVTGLLRARDVSRVANLSEHPGAAVHKQLVADLVRCPTLGATAEQPQANPLLDNYEGLAVTGQLPLGRRGSRGPRIAGLSLISDDNFGPTQVTRVLDLAALLP